jgi:hypothetical protein
MEAEYVMDNKELKEVINEEYKPFRLNTRDKYLLGLIVLAFLLSAVILVTNLCITLT